jgi:hypothetical protein
MIFLRDQPSALVPYGAAINPKQLHMLVSTGHMRKISFQRGAASSLTKSFTLILKTRIIVMMVSRRGSLPTSQHRANSLVRQPRGCKPL